MWSGGIKGRVTYYDYTRIEVRIEISQSVLKQLFLFSGWFDEDTIDISGIENNSY